MFPAKAMIRSGFPCLCSSATQFLALVKESCGTLLIRTWACVHVRLLPCIIFPLLFFFSKERGEEGDCIRMDTYRTGDIIYDDCSCSTTIVHRSQTMVPLLACCVPDLKLYCCILHANSLRQKCCPNCRFLQ